MRAMIFAAGLGKRLKPLTEITPKALIEINNIPMLEIVIRRLIKAGVNEIVINLFHLADKIAEFLAVKKNFGIRIELSRESELLDTGGGLKKAAGFFNDREPFFLHNVDVMSNIDLKLMYKFHLEKQALATVAVQQRQSSRYFLFDHKNELCGWESAVEERVHWAGTPNTAASRLAFCGIHVISPEIFPKMTETGVFSIKETYLRLAQEGEGIQAFRVDGCWWADAGDPQKLQKVRQDIQKAPHLIA